VHYCRENHIAMCIVGSHGYGAITKSLRSLVGLGSVSDYCVHNLHCAVAVVRPPSSINQDPDDSSTGRRGSPTDEDGEGTHEHAS
jgi:hypothetical protein